MTAMGEHYTDEESWGGFFPTALEPMPGLYDVKELAGQTGCDPSVLESVLFGYESDSSDSGECFCDESQLGTLDQLVAPAGWETADQAAKRLNLKASAAAYLAKVGVPKGGRVAYSRRKDPETVGLKSSTFFDPKHFEHIGTPMDKKNDLEISTMVQKTGLPLEVISSYMHLENVATRQRRKGTDREVACVGKNWAMQAMEVLKNIEPLPKDTNLVTHLDIAEDLARKYGVPVNPQGVHKKLLAIDPEAQIYIDQGRVVTATTKEQESIIKQKYDRLLAHYPIVNGQEVSFMEAPTISLERVVPEAPESPELEAAPQPDRLQPKTPVTPRPIPKERVASRHPLRCEMSTEPIDPNVVLPGRCLIPDDLPKVKNHIDRVGIVRYPPIGKPVDRLGIKPPILAAAVKYFPEMPELNKGQAHIGIDDGGNIVISRRANAILCGIFTKNLGGERAFRIPPYWSILNGIAEVVYNTYEPGSSPAPSVVESVIDALVCHAKERYNGFEEHTVRVDYRCMSGSTYGKFIFCSPRLARELLVDNATDMALVNRVSAVIQKGKENEARKKLKRRPARKKE